MRKNIFNRKIHSIVFLSLTCITGFTNATSVINQEMSPTLKVQFENNSNPKANEYLLGFFKAFIARDKTALESMLSKGYIQKFGGSQNDRDEFIQHSLVLSKQLKTMDILFKDVNIDSNGTISEIHVVEVTELDGSKSKFKLYAFYYFDNDGKLKLIDELSTMLEGSNENKDMGSRTK